MDHKTIIEALLKEYPQLPSPKFWEKHRMIRYYFNMVENGTDYTFYIDFSDDDLPNLSQKKGGQWHSKFPKKQDLVGFLNRNFGGKNHPLPNISSEFYQIDVKKFGSIYCYNLEISGGKIQKIGGRPAYPLCSEFGGHWNFSEYTLLSNKYIEESQLNSLVERLWGDNTEIFNNLTKITYIENKEPSPKAFADFAASYLESNHRKSIKQILEKYGRQETNIKITRISKIRGWDIYEVPAISISINSNMIYEDSIDIFMKNMEKKEELIGCEVIDIYLNHRGRITGITGLLKEHRDRLLKIGARELIKQKIENAPEDEIVFSIDNKYDYVASSLYPIVTTKNAYLFKVDSRKLMNKLTISPEFRVKMEHEIIKLFQVYIVMNFNSETAPMLFKEGQEIGFQETIRFNDGTTHNSDEYVIKNLQRHGIYQLSQKFKTDKTIRICLVIATSIKNYGNFWNELKKQLRNLGFLPKLVTQITLKNIDRLHIEEAVTQIPKEEIDIVVGILPEKPTKDKVYELFKSSLFNQNIVESQFIFEKTINLTYALANVVLGILAKTGNVPYILAEPLDFADFFVGIDISREKKSGLKGTQNYLAMARFYGQDGTFANYQIHEDKIEGETVPEIILERIFAKNQFRNKKIMIHRDGFFRGSEITDLRNIGIKYDIQFQFVEVIKTNAPRLFGSSGGKYSNPERNQILYLSKQEAIIINNKVTGNKTANPLRVRVIGDSVDLNDAIKSVMALRLMHFGATKTPKLPVTISFSDRISGFARRGIKPPHRSGEVPWWY